MTLTCEHSNELEFQKQGTANSPSASQERLLSFNLLTS